MATLAQNVTVLHGYVLLCASYRNVPYKEDAAFRMRYGYSFSLRQEDPWRGGSFRPPQSSNGSADGDDWDNLEILHVP